MNANQLISKLTWEEVTSKDADRRRILRNERMNLQVAVKSGDAIRVGRALREAHDVAVMWGVEFDAEPKPSTWVEKQEAWIRSGCP